MMNQIKDLYMKLLDLQRLKLMSRKPREVVLSKNEIKSYDGLYLRSQPKGSWFVKLTSKTSRSIH